jgi:hypothetical protein
MWLPPALGALNEQEMQEMGLKLSAADLYNPDSVSLKDAVVRFGGGCTGEVISGQGLVLTNHHCGFNFIQSLSTLEKNYLAEGYWADSLSGELPCKGLTITFIDKMENVTSTVIHALGAVASETERESRIKSIGDSLEKAAASVTGLAVNLKSFFYGNEYYLIYSKIYRDIRLVGAPPVSVGRFGGETDNWTWPRHSADFALFRIYADSANNPADYSPANVPYHAGNFFTISMDGIKEGDFSMTYGFPGLTKQYLPAQGLDLVMTTTNPNRIAIRDVKLRNWSAAMQRNDTIKLQYASKYKTIANYYKKWRGELEGLKRNHVLDDKQDLEARMVKWIESDSLRQKEYGNLFHDLADIYAQLKPLSHANDYLTEAGQGIELLGIASRYRKLVELSTADSVQPDAVKAETEALLKALPDAYKNYNRKLDEKTSAELLDLYGRKVIPARRPWIFDYINGNYEDDYAAFLHDLYRKTIFLDTVKLRKFLTNYKPKHAKTLLNDPIYDVMKSFNDYQELQLLPGINSLNASIGVLQRQYMKALREMMPDKKFWPEANSTLRVSYGKIRGMSPRDGVNYSCYSTPDGLLQKTASDNSDYKVPEPFVKLLESKDFGTYAQNGKMIIDYLASCHTTGGNSGSPSINGKGQLTGINFDGVWEGLTTDYQFDELLTNNICVDIRYVLFLIDRYGNCRRLLKEMKFSGKEQEVPITQGSVK